MKTVRCKLNCDFLPSLLLELKRARKELPLLFEVCSVLLFIGFLLVLDFIWVNHIHSIDVEEMEKLHEKDLENYRKQFDSQMNAIHNQNKKIGSDLEAAHDADVNEMKQTHQKELEQKINSIQQQLNGLIGLSKTYWEKHAEKHHINLDLEKDENKNKE